MAGAELYLFEWRPAEQQPLFTPTGEPYRGNCFFSAALDAYNHTLAEGIVTNIVAHPQTNGVGAGWL